MKDWAWVLDRPCPECGFDASDVQPHAVPALLRASAATWDTLLRSSHDAALRRRPRDDRWSPLEYACHVRDFFGVFAARIDMTLRSDEPHFENWDQDRVAVTERYNEQDPQLVATELVDNAERLADLLSGLGPHSWTRVGIRSDGTRFSVAGYSRYILHDCVHHLFDVVSEKGE